MQNDLRELKHVEKMCSGFWRDRMHQVPQIRVIGKKFEGKSCVSMKHIDAHY